MRFLFDFFLFFFFCVHKFKVSGGSNGIGREICLELAKDGCNIAVLDVDFKGAENTCQDIRMLGAKAMPYKANIVMI